MAPLTRRQLLLAAPAAALVTGCGRRTAGDGGAIYLRGNGPDPDSLDQHKARSAEAMVVLRDLFECLTRIGRDGAPVPAAAARWSVSGDGTVYTFELHPGQKWSNGEPLVAADFVAGLRRLVDPATASQYAQVVDIIVNAPDVIAGRKTVDTLGAAAPDDHTVVDTLSTPAP
jgi:oligopeptide transport system substrate-binding protein